MRVNNRQWGASILAWLIILTLLGGVTMIGVKLTPAYIQYFTIKSILESVAQEAQGEPWEAGQFWEAIDKRLAVNDVQGISRKDFAVEREGGSTRLRVHYETRTHLLGNIDVVVMFEHVEPIS